MSAFGELLIGGMVLLTLVGVYLVLSCRVPVADPPPGTEPERVLSMARLMIGLCCIGVAVAGVMLAIAGAGLGRLASH